MNTERAASTVESDDYLDTAIPRVARVRNFLAGGKDFYDCDRLLGDRILEAYPGARRAVYSARAFHARAVEVLAGSGVRQFLDLAAGYEPVVRHAALAVNPDARVVYVDRDPIVLAHGRACESVVDGDWIAAAPTEVDKILSAVKFDFAEPVAVSLVGVVDHIDDQAASVAAVQELLFALAPGSALVMAVATPDYAPEQIDEVTHVYCDNLVPFRPRTHEEFLAHFEGLALTDPGVVPPHRWQPKWLASKKITDADISIHAAVGRKD
jgi:SAM-dependent methyltransferase